MEDYYLTRINKAVDFIDQNLNEDLKVSEVAKAANFSTFHFQRLYKAIRNESPYDTILRRRLEKSVFYLKHHPKMKIHEIAESVGFGSIENFTRQFKARFGHSPSELKRDKSLLNSRIYQDGSENNFHLAYDKSRQLPPTQFKVEVRQEKERPVALIKAIFGADGSALVEAYEKLMAWYESDGNNRPDSKRHGMSIDDPDTTPANHYRYDFAVETDREIPKNGIIEKVIIPAGTYAFIHCQGDILKVGQAWDFLYKNWLPNSEYIPRDCPAIESFLKGPEQIGWETFDIHCCIPIEKINY
ncbi:GyrI-like domain-containing protein [Roseivirga sp. E12]|uniref:AraC family transcriptional regulator n=1 Tax=Roseivirga sp. E12 TaxID=2819237 RepID=UPI001ABCA5E2|nr:GyrI-like domain-containing protein [Roseivirga sp. E12]MBO3697052.1 AraC family transcriptional regulator [Roseivirga sp. E12]